MTDPVVIVGASVAGVAVARALRSDGYNRHIVLLGAELDWPYDKPPLSKQVLTGEWDVARTSLLTPDEARELELDVRLGLRAESLDVAERQVVFNDGTRIGYDACVIATGCAARPSPWGERPGVHVLRTLEDALAIRGAFARGGRVAVVGGGFIGSEVASSARALGLETTVIDPLELPMERLIGTTAANVFVDLAQRNGVDLRLGHGVEAIDSRGGAHVVRLADGSEIKATTVVVGIGAVANDGWLASSGLLVENGIVCDEFCRALGADQVYAAGDVARWRHPYEEEPVRIEHWTNAVDQAGVVAHNVAYPDEPRTYAPIEYVWTDQHGWKFQIVGRPVTGVGEEIVGDLSAERPRAAIVYEAEGGGLAGAVTVNWPRALAECRRGLADSVPAASTVRSLSYQAAAVAARR